MDPPSSKVHEAADLATGKRFRMQLLTQCRTKFCLPSQLGPSFDAATSSRKLLGVCTFAEFPSSEERLAYGLGDLWLGDAGLGSTYR